MNTMQVKAQRDFIHNDNEINIKGGVMEWAVTPTKDLSMWRKWFAWHPVQVGNKWVWLKFIERKGQMKGGFTIEWWMWEYRRISL